MSRAISAPLSRGKRTAIWLIKQRENSEADLFGGTNPAILRVGR